MTTIYHQMTIPLFSNLPERFQPLKSYHEMYSCRRSHLKAWLQELGVRDQATFHNKRQWLQNEGYRQEYNENLHWLLTISSDARRKVIQDWDGPEEQKQRLISLILSMHLVGPSSILAYDLALLVVMCRAGNSLGLVHERDANIFRREAARTALAQYSSWYEFYCACAAGAYYHQPPMHKIPLHRSFAYELSMIQQANPLLQWAEAKPI